jgi:hypothetical protein
LEIRPLNTGWRQESVTGYSIKNVAAPSKRRKPYFILHVLLGQAVFSYFPLEEQTFFTYIHRKVRLKHDLAMILLRSPFCIAAAVVRSVRTV